MRIDRNSPAVVLDGARPVSREFDIDAICKARHGLVHRIVENLGKEMMQAMFIGAADIHGGAAAHGIEAFQNLDVVCGIARPSVGPRIEKIVHRHMGL